MKIAHIIYSFNTGGAETMLIDIINRMSVNNSISLFILNESYSEELLKKIDENVEIIRINRPVGSKNPYYIIKLNFLLGKRKYDVIHLHNSTLPRIIFPCITGSKVFYTVHALNINIKNPERIKRCIAISDSVADDISSRYSNEVVTIPNGIDVDSISVKDNYKWEDKRFRIVQVARLDMDGKGQDILIQAVALLRRKNIDVQLDLIGSGSSLNSLQELCNRVGVKEYVHFLGNRDRTYIYGHLKDYDLLCHPARFEGFGLTVAEAMAAGLPVLVSNEGGPSEIINKGEYGELFENNSPEDCAERIIFIINNYNLSIKKAINGIGHIKNHYSIDTMITKYLNAYKS